MDRNQRLDQLYIFLCYATQDGTDFTRRLHGDLHEASPRFAPWYGERIRAEQQFDRELENRLSTADVVIVVLTRALRESAWCRKEIAMALDLNRDIMVVRMHDDVDPPLSLKTLTPIEFAADREKGWARLVQQLETYAKPEHSADKLGQRIPSADPPPSLRHQAFAQEVRQRQQEESARAADPEGALVAAEERIREGLRREREVSDDVRDDARMRCVNEIPIPAPTKFQDQVARLEEVKNALNDPSVRAILLPGDEGKGKTSLIAEVRRRLGARTLAFEAAGFVYLAVGGYRQIYAGTLLHDLRLLVPGEASVRLGRSLREAISVEDKLDLVLAALGSTPVVVAIDNFDDLLDDAERLRDRDLGLIIQRLVRREDHGIRLLLSAKRELISWQRKYQQRIRSCGLVEGLPPQETRPFLARLDEGGLLGVAALPDAEIRRLAVVSDGVPRFIELVYCLLRSDPNLTLDRVISKIEDQSRDRKEATTVLLQDVISRLDRTEQRVVQALAVYGLPVRPEAVDFLLQEYVSGVNSTPFLRSLEERRLIRRDGERYFLPPKPDAEHVLETVPPGSANDYESPHPLYARTWLLPFAADYFREVARQADTEAKQVDHLYPQLSEIRLRIAAGGNQRALQLIDHLDTTYLAKWGQSNMLAPWRDLLDAGSLSPRQRADNTSAGIAARHGEEDPTGSDTAKLTDLLRQLRERSEPLRDQILLRIQIGNSYLDDGWITTAIGVYRAAARRSRLHLLRYEEGKARTNLGSSLARLGRFPAADRELNRAQRLLSEVKGGEAAQTLARTRLNQGWLWGQLGDDDRGLKLLADGLKIADEVEGHWLKGQLLDAQAALQCARGEYGRAIPLAKESAEIGVMTGNPTLSRQANVSLAQAYLHAGRLDSAAAAVSAAVHQPSGIRALGAWVTYGIVLYRQDKIGDAQAAFHIACTEAWLRIEREPREYQTYDAAGLALCGLALCDEPERIHRSVEMYRRACGLAPVDGARQNACTHLLLFRPAAEQAILQQALDAAGGGRQPAIPRT
ncbi:toll/interleukin-1 receptor domain-containing protein [Nonomuraea sp. NPDC050404]|uniref:toll/interleukin-1 receptor domain-containing protein n=1 Tax=Nonomuraea sp. NPDC050404 TaxID=3155783 RepID=UPI0033CDBD96